MVRHDMQKTKERVRSEQIRLTLGLLTPAERAAEEERKEEEERKQAKEATKGNSLFDE
jgi:hypothetical protein